MVLKVGFSQVSIVTIFIKYDRKWQQLTDASFLDSLIRFRFELWCSRTLRDSIFRCWSSTSTSTSTTTYAAPTAPTTNVCAFATITFDHDPFVARLHSAMIFFGWTKMIASNCLVDLNCETARIKILSMIRCLDNELSWTALPVSRWSVALSY
jgi:hypothetical protein